MQFDTLEQYRRAVDLARVQRGDVVYVSRAFYAPLPEHEKSWLWRHSLEARVQLVTDLELDAPIVVRQGRAASDVSRAAAPRTPREAPAAGPPQARALSECDVAGACATIMFGGVAAFERALGLGVLEPGDCVQFTPGELRTLPPEAYERLESGVRAAGASLCEGAPPTPVAVYRGRAAGERTPHH